MICHIKFFCRKFYFCLALMLVLGSVHGAIPLPSINTNNIVVVTNAAYGAVGDGVSTNTTAIQNAINTAALGGTTNGLTGGTVEIPAAGSSVYLCGPLTMKNYVNLQIDAGAKLQMLPYGSYPNSTNSPTDFIGASSLHDLEISGGGVIDGNGAAWWATNSATSGGISRPKAMFAPTGCSKILIRDITLQNPPNTHISFRNNSSTPCGNVTVTNLTINTPDGTPNTDGIDMSVTNMLLENSSISDGDDHIAMGGGRDVVITNVFFGTGHGCSIGSFTSDGVSNLLVINCTWSGSGNGIRLKCQRGRGGLCHYLTYQNLSMTNVQWPILIYSYYNYGVGTLSGATPYMAATDAVQTVTSTTPIWANITFSNVTATATGGRPPVMIWGVPEMLISNVVLQSVNITGGTKNCEIYNATGIQFIDCKIAESAGINTFTLYNAGITVTNSVATNTLFTFDGLTTNGIGNSLSFYNALASLQNTNALDDGPLTLAASTFTVSNNLALVPSTIFNYTLGTNATTVAVKGNLKLGGTNNILAGGGFTNGTYTLMTYTGSLSGNLSTLNVVPAGYTYSLKTNTVGQVNLLVTLPAPTNLVATATNLQINLKWNAATGATSYNLKRGTVSGTYPTVFSGLTATNYLDTNVTNAVNYFYVVSATGAGGESSNSLEAAAAPLPSNQPTNIITQVSGGLMQLSWPQDHQGWRLQIQTNSLTTGIGTNWSDVAGSPSTNNIFVPIDPDNGCVFLRLIYP